jgi:hypothetical protein
MALFGKRRQSTSDSGPSDAITRFWQWWSSSADELARAISTGELVNYVPEVTDLVKAIDPGLAWEFGPGLHGGHSFTVTAEGDSTRRRVARRWLSAAPPADENWSFFDMRQPHGLDHSLQIGPTQMLLTEISAVGTKSGTGVDVVLYHPLFETLPENARTQIAFLGLDAALGEETVELWVGRIEAATTEPRGSQPLADLGSVVNEVIADNQADGAMGWSLMRGQSPDGPVLVTCLNRLKSIQAPLFDLHAEVKIPFRDKTAEGWPGPGSLDSLRQLQDHLETVISGVGMIVAIQTLAGTRTMHFYLDSDSPAFEQLRVATKIWDQGTVVVTSEPDPSWQRVRQFGA